MTDERANQDRADREKLRTCPTCRMEISVLATRCRFCGSEVGRPKEAARSLTATDLGGETIYHRAPSGSVLDAMEAFRAEEETTISHPKSSPGTARVDELPNLDMGAKDVLGLDDPKKITSAVRHAPPSGAERTRTIAIAVVVLIAVIFGAVKGFAFLQARSSQPEEGPVEQFENRAMSMLKSGGSPIKALAVAVEANNVDPSPQNSKIEEDVFLAVKAQVDKLIGAEKWSLDGLRMASTLSSEAVDLYPNPSSIALKTEVDAENSDYKLVLMSTTANEATFKLNSPRETVTVKRGDTILGRFFVQSVVGQTVKLEDSKRDGRVVTFDRPGSLPH